MSGVELDGLPPVDPALLEQARRGQLVRDVIAVRQLADKLADLEAAQRRNVQQLRTGGVTWATIGEAVGTTRQAAQQRFGASS